MWGVGTGVKAPPSPQRSQLNPFPGRELQIGPSSPGAEALARTAELHPGSARPLTAGLALPEPPSTLPLTPLGLQTMEVLWSRPLLTPLGAGASQALWKPHPLALEC